MSFMQDSGIASESIASKTSASNDNSISPIEHSTPILQEIARPLTKIPIPPQKQFQPIAQTVVCTLPKSTPITANARNHPELHRTAPPACPLEHTHVFDSFKQYRGYIRRIPWSQKCVEMGDLTRFISSVKNTQYLCQNNSKKKIIISEHTP